MHILDLIMYFVTCGIIWFLLDKMSDSEYTEELGALVGWFTLFVYTILYTMVFCIWPDLNWIDIFRSTYHLDIKLEL